MALITLERRFYPAQCGELCGWRRSVGRSTFVTSFLSENLPFRKQNRAKLAPGTPGHSCGSGCFERLPAGSDTSCYTAIFDSRNVCRKDAPEETVRRRRHKDQQSGETMFSAVTRYGHLRRRTCCSSRAPVASPFAQAMTQSNATGRPLARRR